MPPTPPCPPRRHVGRRGWVAGLLSFFLCGLGQLYAGSWRRALAFYAVDLVVQVGALLSLVHVRTEPLNLYLPLGVYLLYRAAVIVDAVRVARRAGGFRRRWFVRWPIYVALIVCDPYVVSYQAALALRDYVAEAFRMTATSMSDTLLPGDRFLVDKLFYSEPARLDVVVYRWTDPEGKEETYVDRIIGMPGERVAILNNRVLIDGRELNEPYVRLDGDPQWDFKPMVVPPGSYFVLGDRRNRSRDSRDPDIGFIAREQIVGPAMTIFYSSDSASDKMRWGRIGRVIR
ncbi:MAG: signal peptidase I [Planctomycetota bacterium]